MLPTGKTCPEIPVALYRSKLLSVVVVDAQGRVRSANDKFRETFGKPQQRFEDTFFAEAHHPDDAAEVRRVVEQCRSRSDAVEVLTLRTLRPSGTFDETEWEFSALSGETEQTEGILCISHGIAQSEKQPQAFKSNEEKLLQISRSISDVYFTTDLELRTTYVSPSIEKVMGYPVEVSLIKPVEDRYPPDTLRRFREALREELEREKDGKAPKDRTRIIEGQQYHADGSLLSVNFHVSFLRDARGEPAGLQGIIRDVTESRRRAEELRLIKNRYEQMAIRSRTVVWEVDLDGLYTFVNSAIEVLYGHRISEIVGKRYFFELCPEEYRERFKADMLALIRSGEKFEGKEGVFLAADGTEVHVLTSGEPCFDKNGKITGYRGSGVDITAKKKAEAELRSSHERLSRLANASRTAVWDMDAEGIFTYVSREAEIVYGRKPQEMVGKYFYEFHPAEGREAFKAMAYELMKSGAVVANMENPMEKPSGEVGWLNTGGFPRYDDKGNMIGYSGSDTDITARKLAENALIEREHLLRELLLDKDRMAKMQAMLFDIASKYINIPLSEVPEAVRQSLREIGEYSGTHRVVVFSYDFAANTAKCLYEWSAPGIEPMIDRFQEVSLEDFPNMKEAHQSGRSLYVANTSNIDKTSPERDILIPRDVRTSFSFPMMRGGECVGFVGMESVGELHEYGDREEILLEVFSELLVNVQDREKSEKELSRMQVMLEETGQMSGVGGFEMNLKSGLHYWSAVTKHIHEVPMDFEPDIGSAIAFYKEGAAREEIKRLVEESITEGTPFEAELPIITARGNERVLKVQGRTEFDGGQPVRLYGTVSDITEKRRKEESERLLLEISQNQNDRLKNFAHIVAHNLRSHSGNIESLLGLIEDAREDLKDFDLMRLLRRVSDSLRDTLGHLSEVALLHTAEREPLADVKLKDHICGAIEAVGVDLHRDDVEIINELNGDEAAKALPAYLDSILLNLLTNALKYRSKERPCIIRISSAIEDRYLRLTVADNGMGIDLERHGAKIFGMFKTFHDHPEARGIGLFITKNQVESMGGRIDVESAENEGTSFHVRLLKAEG